MDKIINTHIDNIEELERQLDIIIEQEISQIDIDTILNDPTKALNQVIENVKRVFLDEYANKAIELGFDLGRIIKKRIEQDKTIKVDDSNNPNLNDTGKDNKQD